jgi:hypothetical protein
MGADAECGGGRTKGDAMDDFPEFMKGPANRIATSSQATPGVEGYVFDGADGSQMAFWTCYETADTLIIDGKRIPVGAGEEYVIPRGVWHGGEPLAGTRTIHAFGGRRAERALP